jgi:ribulose-phosphate 3-epimerase
MKIKLAPSILAAHFERLGEEVRAVEEAGADMLHVDVMDGHFVPNISMGPLVVEALRRTTRLPLDVHLMIEDPIRYADAFIDAGAHHITFHVEVVSDPRALARRLRGRGVGAGLTLNPETPVDKVLDFVGDFDMILIMSVHPGFGGQAFIPETLEKAKRIREVEKARAGGATPIDLEIDGGIDLGTAALARKAGCNVFVAGNAIFRKPDPGEALRALRASLECEKGSQKGS